MSAPQSPGGYAPQPTYPPPYGQPQSYPPAAGQSGGYPQTYQPQQQYPSYQQAQPQAAAPEPKRGGGMLKIMAILVLVGLVLGGVGFLVIGVVNASVYNTAKNCATASNPGLCGAQAQANLYNDTGIGEIISGVGFVLAGIGFGMFLLALPRKFDELAQKP